MKRVEDSERGSVFPKASQLASEIQRTIHVLDSPGDGKFVSMPDWCEQYVTLNEQGMSSLGVLQ